MLSPAFRFGFVFCLSFGVLSSACSSPTKARRSRVDATSVEDEVEGTGGTPARGGASGQGGRGGTNAGGSTGTGGSGTGGFAAGMGGMSAGAGGSIGMGGTPGMGGMGMGGLATRSDAGVDASARPDVVVTMAGDAAVIVDMNAPSDRPVTSNPDVAAIVPGLQGLRGEYFAWAVNPGEFTDKRFERVDSVIEFDWMGNSPDNGALVPNDKFEIRWTGKITAPVTDTYTFIVRSDDGVRLWVNGAMILNNWVIQGAKDVEGSISLQAGVPVDIRLEYFDSNGQALLRLSWIRTGDTNRVVVPSSVLKTSATLMPTDAGMSDAQNGQ